MLTECRKSPKLGAVSAHVEGDSLCDPKLDGAKLAKDGCSLIVACNFFPLAWCPVRSCSCIEFFEK